MITDKIIYLISQEFFRNGKKTLIINIFYKSLQKVAKELNISIDKLLIKIFFLYFPFLPFKIRQIKVKSGKIKKKIILPSLAISNHSPIEYIIKFLSLKIKSQQKLQQISLAKTCHSVIKQAYTEPEKFLHYYKPYKHIKLMKKQRAYLHYLR
jgi:hypothetical protein